MLSNNYQNISLKLKEPGKHVTEKSISMEEPLNYVEQSIVPMCMFLLTEHGSVKTSHSWMML